MKALRFLFAATLLFGLLFASCEPVSDPIDTPTQEENTEDEETTDEGSEENGKENGEDEENKDNGNQENTGDELDNSWMENPQPLPDATYKLSGGLTATSYVSYADGLRNDYLSFYEASRDYALYIDLYTSELNTMLSTGRYLLADTFKNSAYREYCYLTLETDGELNRFTEGWVEVIADAEHESGYPLHNIRAYFVMESGESVSLEYEGTIILK